MTQLSFRKDVLPLKDKLFRLALRITLDRTEAEDVVQETLIKVWERREQWEQIDSIEAFSYTVCRNLSLDKSRKADKISGSLDQIGADVTDNALSPAQDVMLKDSVLMVRKLLDELPEKQRSCMQLRDFEGKSYKEIATILQISEEQVKVNIFRARQTIKSKFEQADSYGL